MRCSIATSLGSIFFYRIKMFHTIKRHIESSKFQNFIMSLIILNGITMGLETSKQLAADYGSFFEWFNFFVITVFTIEYLLRVWSSGVTRAS